ncbi:MAG: UDP-N-acetylmuramoyl-L-alanine--D-glutamate ligase [Gammaproteobacteria bacterium]|nr:UDP-N-acetylmuramoyl-L-alanine--D-glutamate ligase [Gammaproteobacteria bacterium]
MQPCYLILGSGASGLSAARFLARNNTSVSIADTRMNPPNLDAIYKELPQVSVQLGAFKNTLLDNIDQVVISPGLSLNQPLLDEAKRRKIPVIGDIEIFCQHATAPIIAVTGSNAKSTVVTLLAQMISDAGFRVGLGGNIGTPALELLGTNHDEPDFYVLELSSFQLETTFSLKAKVASILNISSDHMDRYEGLDEYTQTKQRIYNNCASALYSRDDQRTVPLDLQNQALLTFGLSAPEQSTDASLHEYGILTEKGCTYLARGSRSIMATDELKVMGAHNHVNCLAALAIGTHLGLEEKFMLKTLRNFSGLKHRCEWVATMGGVSWINDSKGTNVGSTLAAIKGFGEQLEGEIILLLGGLSKGGDFSPLIPAINSHVKLIFVFGKDAKKITRDLSDSVCRVHQCKDLDEAVNQAHQRALAGDLVLFSPACASFDMFDNFEKRGEAFKLMLNQLQAESNSEKRVRS